MYGKSVSSGVESMNHANHSIPDAWKRDVFCEEKPLTPREMLKLSKIFHKCDTAIFIEDVFMHVWKKPLEYWGMIPFLRGLLGLWQSGGHHGQCGEG